MKLYNIRKIPEFFERISACEGDVYALKDDGSRIDMKKVAEECRMLEQLGLDGRIEELNLITENPEDMVKVYRFAMEACAS